MTNGKTTTLKYRFEKETPGTLRFQQVDAAGIPLSVADGAVCPTLYIRKTAFNGTVPTSLTVTVAAN